MSNSPVCLCYLANWTCISMWCEKKIRDCRLLCRPQQRVPCNRTSIFIFASIFVSI